MQTLSSRETPPEEMFVFSMCDIHGGLDPETGRDTMHMEGTCRTFNPAVNAKVEEWARRIFTETCAAYGVTATVSSECIAESVINDPDCTAIAKNALLKLFGKEADHPLPPTTGSEDFSYYLAKCPEVLCQHRDKHPGQPLPLPEPPPEIRL